MRFLIIAIFSAAAAAQPVRTCESLSSLALTNTTIESAAVEPAAAGRPG